MGLDQLCSGIEQLEHRIDERARVERFAGVIDAGVRERQRLASPRHHTVKEQHFFAAVPGAVIERKSLTSEMVAFGVAVQAVVATGLRKRRFIHAAHEEVRNVKISHLLGGENANPAELAPTLRTCLSLQQFEKLLPKLGEVDQRRRSSAKRFRTLRLFDQSDKDAPHIRFKLRVRHALMQLGITSTSSRCRFCSPAPAADPPMSRREPAVSRGRVARRDP